jgi:signal transduction histidine kinase
MHAERMQVLGTITSSVAHDLGNLIQGVTACLDLALLNTTAREKAREYVKQARVALRHGSALAKQLTSIGRREVTGMRPVSVDEVVAEFTLVLKHLAGSQVTLQIDAGAPGSAIMAHPVQLAQILLNLVANGRDAMPAGGTLTIRTRREWDGPGSTAQPRLRLEVRDSGSGMDPATRARLFEPFFTTKRDGEGTGLGLSVVRALTSALRGDVRVESEPGCGTAFVFTFPEVVVEDPARDFSDGEGTAMRPKGTEDTPRPRRNTGVFPRGSR